MDSKLKYIPVFRGLQEEITIIRSYDFGVRIYPYFEIIKERDRESNTPNTQKPPKTFEQSYYPIIEGCKAEHIFVDLPNHIKYVANMKPPIVDFFLRVINRIDVRTRYMKKLERYSKKVIPVISSYYHIDTEDDSIEKQEGELRKHFPNLAFRTFVETFMRDYPHIKNSIRPDDYIIMDWDESILDHKDDENKSIIKSLTELGCTIVMHRNAIFKETTMTGLLHDQVVDSSDNGHLDCYKKFGATAFSDYCGIKKGELTKGGMTSPGFIYYDAVDEKYYGFRYKYGGHKKGEIKPSLDEFEDTIIPAVIDSMATRRMKEDEYQYLGEDNLGWKRINEIHEGATSGKQASKFKWISMQHYLHCLKTQIEDNYYG